MTRSITQKEFDNMVWQAIGCSYDWMFEKPRSVINESLARYILRQFCDKYGEKNAEGWKMRWQMEKTFDIKRRLNTWIQNSKEWDKGKWIEHNKNPQGLKAPVIHRTPEQIEESKEMELGYERLRNRVKTEHKPTAFGKLYRDKILRQDKAEEHSKKEFTDFESVKQSEQKYTDYE